MSQLDQCREGSSLVKEVSAWAVGPCISHVRRERWGLEKEAISIRATTSRTTPTAVWPVWCDACTVHEGSVRGARGLGHVVPQLN